jgi:2,3-bisphosphoglycerate-independent phosphoglycerate mutase
VTVLFVFVDGVGAGSRDPDRNPLARGEFLLSRFEDGSGAPLPAGGRAVLADATLGVPGRPQSATGQTAILTGENAPRLLGKHLLGFPNAPLRALLRERSLFLALARSGRRAVFANSYPLAYLRALGIPAEGEPEFALGKRRARPAATTVAYAAGGGAFRTWADARAGRGLTHDITGQTARRRGADVPAREPAEAADLFLALSRGHDLALFEFFETDEAGHAQSMERALDAIGRVDAFVRRLAARIGPEDALVVASDHGNVEDLGVRNHTLSPVPVLGFGRAAGEIAAVRDLTHVAALLARLAGGDVLPRGASSG